MIERPIPYSPQMVRARREGRKTQTRRLAKLPDCAEHVQYWAPPSGRSQEGWADPGVNYWTDSGNHIDPCPYGQLGDRLWVREAYRTPVTYNHLPPRDIPHDAPIWYEADGPAPEHFAGGKYRHARFMPRRITRGLDEITRIRVERLQDISETDALSEGVIVEGWPGAMCAKDAFHELWATIHGPHAWDANPWLWVIEFQVLA